MTYSLEEKTSGLKYKYPSVIKSGINKANLEVLPAMASRPKRRAMLTIQHKTGYREGTLVLYAALARTTSPNTLPV
jgi:hypothetical protein